MLQDDRAESPIEVIFIVMLAVMLMAIVVFVFGSFIDQFMYTWGQVLVDMPLSSSWAKNMYANIVTDNVSLFWQVPGFFIMVIVIWAVKTMIKKHEYTTQDEFMSDEY